MNITTTTHLVWNLMVWQEKWFKFNSNGIWNKLIWLKNQISEQYPIFVPIHHKFLRANNHYNHCNIIKWTNNSTDDTFVSCSGGLRFKSWSINQLSWQAFHDFTQLLQESSRTVPLIRARQLLSTSLTIYYLLYCPTTWHYIITWYWKLW